MADTLPASWKTYRKPSRRYERYKMKAYKYIKSNAFTTGDSLGNPAACLFLGDATMTGEQMQTIASEHKGFVMEMVFCGHSDKADAKLTYYSSEC